MKTLLYILFNNHENYFSETLASAIENKKETDFDIVIIDTDPSEQSRSFLQKVALGLCEVFEYKAKLPSVINFVYEKYCNVYDYIIRLDGDDRLKKGAIKYLANFAEKNPEVAAIFGSWEVIDTYGRKSFRVFAPDLDTNVGFHGACTLLKTKSIKDLNFLELGIDCQDGFATFIHLLKKGCKVANVKKVIFDYRRHSNNLSSRENKLWKARKKILSHYSAMVDKKIPRIVILTSRIAGFLSKTDRQFLRQKDIYYINSQQRLKGKNLNVDLISYEGESLSSKVMKIFKQEECIAFINPEKLAENYKVGLVKSFFDMYQIRNCDNLFFARCINSNVWSSKSGNNFSLNFNSTGIKFLYMQLPGLLIFANRGNDNNQLFSNNFLNNDFKGHLDS